MHFLTVKKIFSWYKENVFSANPMVREIMTQTPSHMIDEKTLTKGQLRKLNVLRRSVGDEIGEKAFTEWLSSQKTETKDKNAELIASTLWSLIEQRSLMIPRGGYLVKRGRGRIVVEPANP